MKRVVLVVAVFALLFSVLAVAVPNGGDDRGPLGKVTFIHYKKGHAKPPGAGGGKGGSACYGFLANGAKWKVVENYSVNPTGSGVDGSFAFGSVSSGAGEWETYGGNIFGSAFLDYSAPYDDGVMDGVNTAAFGTYPDSGVIAVTTVWGYFYGPPKSRELVEWDMLFNTYYQWGDAANDSALMDLPNIATHELGHSAGMADLYESTCAEETMYGYSQEGETKKRNLNSGDIAGIKKLYGA